jgi:serine/threonine-protein kinase
MSQSRLAAALADRYTVERELGAGGMATVYLAEDLRHRRKVALKVLKPELAAVLGGERFVQEITTTAALQHPHILPLFDSGTAEGFLYYVMPYVQGETLRSKLDRETQLGIDEAVRITREVADALDYAHRHGVIHRDIKPENILLHDGRPMVADFGIALAVSAAAGGRMTETGLSLGTPHYMSPEQATAEKDLTGRSDIYSLGCVLYEMLTGNPPHTGATAQQIIMKIVTEEAAPVTRLRRSVPANVADAVAKAVERLPADRFASAKAFADALGDPAFVVPATRAHSAVGAPLARSSARRLTLVAAASGLVLGLLGLFAGLRWRRPAEPPPTVRFALALPDSARYVDTPGRSLAITPDGRALVYSGGTISARRLYLRRLDQAEPVAIPGTEGGYNPFFSPDGAWLGFVANQRLMKVRIAGGTPVTVAPLLGNVAEGAAWGDGDLIVLEDVRGLSRVSAGGGRLEAMTAPSAEFPIIWWPTFLPGGDLLLCAVRRADGSSRLGLVTVPDGRLTVLDTLDGTDPRFISPGTVAWLSGDGVMLAAPFDVHGRRFTGPAAPVMEGVLEDGGAAKIAFGPGISVRVEGSSQRAELVRLDRRGNPRIERSEQMAYAQPRFSPDGRHIAVAIAGTSPAAGDLWVLDRARGTRQRLTLQGAAMFPEWSPDGRHIAFGYLRRDGANLSWDIYSIASDGSAVEDSLVTGPATERPGALASDGSLIFTRIAQGLDILYRDAAGAEHEFAASAANESMPTLSPDGRWLAFVSDESGTREVYVRPFPTGAGRWQISIDGGTEPRWSRNGREIVYRRAERFQAVELVPGPGLSVGRTDTLFSGFYDTGPWPSYDVSRDGSEFIVVRAGLEGLTLSVHLQPLTARRKSPPR